MPTGIWDIKKKDTDEVVSDPMANEDVCQLAYHTESTTIYSKGSQKAVAGIAQGCLNQEKTRTSPFLYVKYTTGLEKLRSQTLLHVIFSWKYKFIGEIIQKWSKKFGDLAY